MADENDNQQNITTLAQIETGQATSPTDQPRVSDLDPNGVTPSPQQYDYIYHPERVNIVPIDQINFGQTRLQYRQAPNGNIEVTGDSDLGVGILNTDLGTTSELNTVPVPEEDPNQGFPSSEIRENVTGTSRGTPGIAVPIRITDGVQITPYISPFGEFDVGARLDVNILGERVQPVQITPEQSEEARAATNLGMEGLVQQFRIQQNIILNGDGNGNVILREPARIEAVPIAPEANPPAGQDPSQLQSSLIRHDASALQGVMPISMGWLQQTSTIAGDLQTPIEVSTTEDKTPRNGLTVAEQPVAGKSQQR